MRKMLCSVVMFVGCTIGLVAVAGAFTQRAVVYSTASITFTQAGLSQCSIQLLKKSDLTAATSIWWNESGITLGQTAWKMADVFAVMTSTLTDVTASVQIYTDNTAASANPKYLGISTTTVGGLVGYHASYPQVSSTTLSMCWRVMNSTDVLSAPQQVINQGVTNYPDRLYATDTGYPVWVWMMDRISVPNAGMPAGGWPTGAMPEYAVIKGSIKGIQHAEATWASGCASPDAIFFGANFTSALGGATYKTSTLTIESFTE